MIKERDQTCEDLRRDKMELDRSVALLKHDCKEAQRKLEQELEMRRKAESSLQDTKDQLHAEISARVKVSSNTQHANEKNLQLDKQIHELTEKFKSERDTTAKYKKSYSDLQQRYNSVEHAYSELTVKYKELNSSKTSLEKKLIGLQSALEEEKNTQSRNSDYIKELENRTSTLQGEISRLKNKDTVGQNEIQRQQNAVISLEKSKANIELELKTVRMKYDQEALAHKETIARFNADKKNILHSTEEANLEALKANFVVRNYANNKECKYYVYCVTLPCVILPCLTLPCVTLPCLTLPCITLPCLTLPCVILPCLTLPCITLPCLTLPCVILPCLTLPCLTLPCVILPCLALPCLALPCLTLPCLILSCLILPCVTVPCVTLPCLILSYLILPCLTLPCLILPCLTLPCLTLPCLILPCLILPCLTLPCLILPCLTLPCLTLPCLTLPCLILPCLILHCVTLRCLILSCLILPCVTLPCLTLPCLILHCLTLPCLILPCLHLPCLILPCLILPCVALPCVTLPSLTLPSLILLCLTLPCLILPCLHLPCLTLPCLTLPCVILPCLTLPCLTLPCLILSYLILPCLILPCVTLPCLILSCLTLPCLTLSCLTLSCLILSCLTLPSHPALSHPGKYEQQRVSREGAEIKLLEVEKTKSELSVDLSQLKQQVHALKTDLRSEIEKAKSLSQQIEPHSLPLFVFVRPRAKSLSQQIEQEIKKRTQLQSELMTLQQANSQLRSNEKQLTQEVNESKADKKSLEEEHRKVKEELNVNELQMKELHDQLEAENYFSTLYKTQVRELKEEVDEKLRLYVDLDTDFKNLENDRDSIAAQLQLAVAKADSEQLARSIAEEQLSDVEKEKTMLELELKEAMSRLKSDITKKDMTISSVEDNNKKLVSDLDMLQREKEQLNIQINQLRDEIMSFQPDKSEVEQLKKILEDEKMKKTQAVNKLAEVMNRRAFSEKPGKKVSASELRKKEKECRKLQQELNQEKAKFNIMAEKLQRDLNESQAALYEESQKATRLQMELDAHESEVEQLQGKLALYNSDNMSVNSGPDLDGENRLEGWLSVPKKQNIKRHGWTKQYVVVSSKKILFYDSENSKQNADPARVLDIDKLFHIRPVTQGDVIRAESDEIPRIFQILYATEGENKKPGDILDPLANQDKSGLQHYKGHDFIPIHFRTPTSCDSCNKPVWSMIHPPTALECRLCHVKVHKEHFDRNEEFIGYCKVNLDIQSAKEMLILAASPEEQKMWIQGLSKKITKRGYVHCGGGGDKAALGAGPARGSKQYASFNMPAPTTPVRPSKVSTLPPNTKPLK
ncbi:hypothetical protein LSAT2_016895 [Lamellibrachia satsuma]|nr:hypothetical protein LSAT2_016895 [Lamellibrachia satsuma]